MASNSDKLVASRLFADWVSRPDVVYLDTETAGKELPVVEVSVCDRDGKPLIDTLVRPGCLIEPGAMNVHHITEEMVATAPTFAQIWPELKSAIDGKLVVIYNVTFDVPRLRQSANGGGPVYYEWMEVEKRTKWVCAMRAYSQYYGEYNYRFGNYKWHTLGTALFQQGIMVDEAFHRAMADVQATRLLCEHCAKFAAQPITTGG